MKLIVRAGAMALFGAALSIGSVASAQEGVAVKNLLGDIGLIPKDKDPIRYRERAPLVLPPKMDLREPATAGSLASNNPQWPNDPDVVARKARIARDRVPVTESEIRRMAERNPNLSIDEMRSGRNPGAQNGPVPGSHRGDNARDVLMLNPDQIAGQKTDTSDADPTVRRTLADPPTSFRKSAQGGAVNGTYDVKVDQQTLDANPMTWLTRKFRKDDDD